MKMLLQLLNRQEHRHENSRLQISLISERRTKRLGTGPLHRHQKPLRNTTAAMTRAKSRDSPCLKIHDPVIQVLENRDSANC